MRDGGLLCDALGTMPNTRLSRFCWSGSNTHTARLTAGEDLAVHLRDLIEQFPHAEHFVVAHSHGGNVALYAMKDKVPTATGKVLQEQIAGIVTLATPFVAVRPRELPGIVRKSVGFTLVLAAVLTVYWIVDPKLSGFPQSNVVGLATLFSLWLVTTAISARLYRGRKFRFMDLLLLSLRAKSRPERTQLLNRELDRLRPEATDLDRLLVVRPLGDEASMGLVVSQFFSYVQNRVLNALESAQEFLLRGFSRRSDSTPVERSWAAGAFLGLLKLLSLIGLCLSVASYPSLERRLIFEVLPFNIMGQTKGAETLLQQLLYFLTWFPPMTVLAVYVAFSLASLIGLFGLLLSAIPFGVDAMFWNNFASTTVETSPLGSSPAQIYVADPQSHGLAHSGIYEDEGAIKQIVEWIRSRADRGVRNPR
jgi:hypothetical protein